MKGVYGLIMKIIAATSNPGKVKEIKKIFSGPELEIVSMKEAGIDIEVEENGTSVEENALIKARALSEISKCAVIADDSGLCVDALGGRPGIYSARYAGENATDGERIEKLLSELVGEKNRRARFVSVVAFITANGREFCACGEVLGRIAEEIKGDGGFGYDPVFYSDELRKTFGEASTEEKNSISHRARAIHSLYEILKENKILS